MNSVKGTKTAYNLMAAFAGESQARNKYTYFASVAKKEGFVQIQKVFEETADQEKEHAKRLFKLMDGGEVTLTETFPCGPIPDVKACLQASIDGENHEWQHMYPDFAKIAREEGFTAIATVFEAIAVAEKQHAKRFQGLLDNILNGTVFKKDGKVFWRCLNCGYVHEGDEAPAACPACAHPRDYFELLGENW